MHFGWNAQRGRATVTSTHVPVVRIAAVVGTVGLLAVSAPIIWTAVSSVSALRTAAPGEPNLAPAKSRS